MNKTSLVVQLVV